MTIHDHDRGTDLFAERTVDLTPTSAREAVTVLFAPVSRDPRVSARCASFLSEEERSRARRFSAAADRARFEQRRAFRRYCGAIALRSPEPLSDIRFEATETGRPHLAIEPDLWFSFSSCRVGMLGAWSSSHAVGVDIEDQTRKLEAADLALRFFSAPEAVAVREVAGEQRRRTFYRLWTLKEAALKSIGQGLPLGLDAFEFELDPMPRLVRAPPECGGPARFDVHPIDCADSCAALVIHSEYK